MNAVHKIVIFVCYLKLYYCNVEDENLPCKERRICASCDWTGWSECSRSCGGGIKTRYRHYNVPVTWGNKEISNKCNTSDNVTKEVKQCGEICMNGGTYINQDNERCLCGKHFDGPCCEEGLGFKRTPFRNKMEANTFLRNRRVKRSLNEECGESGSCSYEEVREVHPGWGRPSICNFFKQRQCGNIYCTPGTYCDTWNDGGCSRLSNYAVHCKDVNECNSSPCRHGGTCHNEHNRFRCTCDPHFYGTTCQNNCNLYPHCIEATCTNAYDSVCKKCEDQTNRKTYSIYWLTSPTTCDATCSWKENWCWPGECSTGLAKDCVCKSEFYKSSSLPAKCDLKKAPDLVTCRLGAESDKGSAVNSTSGKCFMKENIYMNFQAKYLSFTFTSEFSIPSYTFPMHIVQFKTGLVGAEINVFKKDIYGKDTYISSEDLSIGSCDRHLLQTSPFPGTPVSCYRNLIGNSAWKINDGER